MIRYFFFIFKFLIIKIVECPFCQELIPVPFPEKIQICLKKLQNYSFSTNQKLSKELTEIFTNAVDQHEFCRIHHSELIVVPDGCKKNYPIAIDFENMPKRLNSFIPQLISIIEGQQKSFYKDLALKEYKDLRKFQQYPLVLIHNGFEKFMVIFL